jgi:hypothetical protein
MAKRTNKPEPAPKVKPTKKVVSRTKAKANPEVLIEKACVSALAKLKAMNADTGLQSEIEWCLGSYRNDRNPIGLYEMATRALTLFTTTADKNPKAVSQKLLTELKKALAGRG